MKHFELIVTHAGDAHIDDFMSVCLALAINPDATVQRVTAVHANTMNNPKALVLDIGMDDNGKNHFDHHQDNQGPCAFHRFATAMNYAGLAIFPSWQFLSDVDCFGQTAVAKKIGTQSAVLTLSQSIPERLLISIFSQCHLLKPGDNIHEMMTLIGREYIQTIEDIKNAQDVLKDKIVLTRINDLNVVIVHIEKNPLVGFNYYCRSNNIKPDVIIHPDQRDVGWSIMRDANCDPIRIDFLKFKNTDVANFVHANGFFMTTKKRLEIAELFNLITDASKI